MSSKKSYQETIQEFIYEYPVCEFYYLERADLIFSEEVRLICEMELRYDNQPWAYPPAMATIEECVEKCGGFEHVLIFSSVTEVRDSRDFLGCMEAKRGHEQFSYNLQEKFRENFGDVLTLTTGCAICAKCAYPGEVCRYPDKCLSTIEKSWHFHYEEY